MEAIASVGYPDRVTMMSIAVVVTSTACWKSSTRNVPSSSTNFMRLSEARLHAESSRCMYSLHGLEPLMRPLFGQVCHRLIVESYCMPGSPQTHAASAMPRIRSRAGSVSITSPVVTDVVCQSLPASTASMNSSVTRTELLAFWNWMDCHAAPLRPMS